MDGIAHCICDLELYSGHELWKAVQYWSPSARSLGAFFIAWDIDIPLLTPVSTAHLSTSALHSLAVSLWPGGGRWRPPLGGAAEAFGSAGSGVGAA